MSWSEHTPPEYSIREDPAELPVSPKEPIQENCGMSEPPHTAQTIPVRDVHLYTIPNREYSGHYPNSQLVCDIVKNPTLYMDRADF